VFIEEWNPGSGVTVGFDQAVANSTSTQGQTLGSTPTGTLAQASELALACISTSVGVSAPSIAAPFALNLIGGQFINANAQPNSVSPLTATFSWTTNATSTVALATYKLVSTASAVYPYQNTQFFGQDRIIAT
jgi:hypothetical protein